MKILKNHKKIMLIITEKCNLDCVYCYEKNKGFNSMDFDTAKKILDNSYKNMDGCESMVIEFHGGEPFINFELIKKIDRYVIDTYSHYPILFRCITNGTLVHGEVQQWLKERADRYEVMLSLDGKKSAHDSNRSRVDGKGSFDFIDLDFFINTWENCPVSMTVNENTLPYMAEGTLWIESLGFLCCSAFEWATDWNLEKSVPILRRELDKLVRYYSDNPKVSKCLLLRYSYDDFYKVVDDKFRYCVEIDDATECYDAKGVFAPCHGFTAFTMGSEELAEPFKNMTICDFVHSDENICKGCKLVRMCRTCFAANHMLTGNMQIQSPEICMFNCLCVMASIEVSKNRALNEANSEDEVREYFKKLDEIYNYADRVYRRELNKYGVCEG